MIDLRKQLGLMKNAVRNIPVVENLEEIDKDIIQMELSAAVYLYTDAARNIRIKDRVSDYHVSCTGKDLEIVGKECGMVYLMVRKGIVVKIPMSRIYILSCEDGDEHTIRDALMNYAVWVVE